MFEALAEFIGISEQSIWFVYIMGWPGSYLSTCLKDGPEGLIGILIYFLIHVVVGLCCVVWLIAGQLAS